MLIKIENNHGIQENVFGSETADGIPRDKRRFEEIFHFNSVVVNFQMRGILNQVDDKNKKV